MPVRILAFLLCCHGLAQTQTRHPGRRTQPSLLYDESGKQVILMDGTYPAVQPDFTELWCWNGTTWTLKPAKGPAGRYSSAAVYDSARNRIVSFAGRVGRPEVIRGDLWEFDGKDWREIDAAGPGPRDHHAMAYDAARRQVVLFGGGKYPRTSPWATDTWTWDGTRWSKAADTGPVGRVAPMVYDGKRQDVILFGGVGEAPASGQPQPDFGDTWAWNGQSWRKVSDTGPSPRNRHALAFDRDRGVVLLYGGGNAQGQLADFWQWDGVRWTEIRMTGPTPGKRELHSMVYDPSRRRTVLYGGNSAGTVVADTWEWDGRRWEKRDDPSTSPRP
jgi:hypothetical protein